MRPVLTSLVITTYNRAAMLAAALESVAQSRVEDRAGVEVIVVDNNSTDGTRQTVQEIQAGSFPLALRYVMEPRQGLSYARNRGIDESMAKYVAFMDDDQLLDKNYLSRIEPVFQDTQATCIGGPVFYYNKGGLPRWLPPLLEIVGQTDYGAERKILGPGIGKLQGGNMVFDRVDLINVGKYDTSLGRTGDSLLAGEEDELQQRLHAAGKLVIYDPGLVQYHYLAPARLKKRFWRRHHFAHGRTLYRMKLAKTGAVSGSSVFGAPRWLWRHLLISDIPAVVWPLMRLDATQGFYRELDVWTRLGEIHEARQQSIRGKA